LARYVDVPLAITLAAALRGQAGCGSRSILTLK
jgi:hypothetical protein